MDSLQSLLDRNQRWAERKVSEDPGFFRRLVAQQAPEYLWIGCADSRVPANQIVELDPGELFVHRNVANVVPPGDANAQSVIEFAVRLLKVRHIMVVGHYGCSGVRAALSGESVGPRSDEWLEHVRAVATRHRALLDAEPTDHRRQSLLCELNVLEQVINVCTAPAVRAAWERGQSLTVHGWIYRLGDGLLRHLDFSVDQPGDAEALRASALNGIVAARAEYYRRKAGSAAAAKR